MATDNYLSNLQFVSDITVSFSEETTINGWPLANIKATPTTDLTLRYKVKVLVKSRNWMTQVKANKKTNGKLFEWGEYHIPGRYSLDWTRLRLPKEGIEKFISTWPFQFARDHKIVIDSDR